MSSYLLDFPPEIRRNIYSHCTKWELRYLACCSSEYYNELKPILWSTMSFTWFFLMEEELSLPEHTKKLENLKLTRKLRIIYDFHRSKDPKMSDNYKILIRHCNPNILDAIVMEEYRFDTDGECVHLTCNLFKKLEKLSIRDDFLPAKSYKSISELDNLVELSLAHSKTNNYNMCVLCEGLGKLKLLDLMRTCVTDSGLVQVSNLKSLQILNMTRCKISSVGLSYISGLPALKELDLDSCCGIKDFSSLQKLSSLEKLILDSCGITDAGLVYLSVLTCLKYLNLNGTCITDVGLDTIRNLNLRNLNIGSTKISDKGLEYISGMKLLQCLTCCHTGISDAGLLSASSLTNLRDIDVGGCFQVTNLGLQHLTGLKFLQMLRCGKTKVTRSELIDFCRKMDCTVSWY